MNWKSEWIRSRTGRFCLGKMAEFYDRWICTPEAVRRQVGKWVEQGKGLKFSVGIPHYNRGGEIYKPLFNAIQHPNVEEIVIVDDGSNEGEFEKLRSFVSSLKGSKAIALHRRNENRKALFTKVEVVEKCSGEWILVLDSDNTFFKTTLDAFGGLEAPSRDTFYCCSFAFPFFDFSPVGYAALDFERISCLAKQGLLQKYYIMNDGNYLVNKKSYLLSARMLGEAKNDEADVITLNYAHISRGGKLKLIQKSRYFHRVHNKSRWLLNAEASKKRLNLIYSRLLGGQPFDNEFRKILSCQNQSKI